MNRQFPPCFLYSNSFVFPISGVSKKLPTLEKMRKGMSVSVIDTDETQYSQEEQLQAQSVTYNYSDVLTAAAAATKTENTHLSFSDSFRLGLHEFFFCGEVRRSVARAHVLIYKENSNIILSPLGIT